MKTSFPFTEASIRALSAPPKGRMYCHDAKCPGLQVCVTQAGGKTYYYRKRVNGPSVRVRLGTTQELSVEAARKAVATLGGQVAQGGDPAAERRQKREEPILSRLWEAYLELHAKPRKKSWKDDERQYAKYMGSLQGKRLSAITKPLVAKWHAQIAQDHGPVQANRSKALLATMFSKGASAVGYAGPNPCVGVASLPERSRERFLLPAEMGSFFKALAAEEPYWQAFFLLCLFTGSRRGNVASMAWQEIDLENAVWHIPGGKTKNKRPTSVALCAPAQAILKKRHEERNGSLWVFPSVRGDEPLVDPRKAWRRVLAAASITDLHIHDLRRTQGSWQAAMGISLAIVGKTLGHVDLKSTQVYARLQLDPVKDAVGRTATALLKAGHFAMGSGVIEEVAIEPASEGKNHG